MDKRVELVCTKLLRQEETNFEEVTEDNFEDIFLKPLKMDSSISFSIAVDNGVSKGVLLIEGADEVIKIPFTGKYDTDSYDGAMSDYLYERENLPEEEWQHKEEPKWEDYFDHFWCASTQDEIDGWDYCERECEIYRQAREKGLEQYFAKEWCVGCAQGHPIYVQERAKIYCDKEEYKRYTREQLNSTMDTCEKLDITCFNSVWISDFIESYGEAELLRLDSFLAEFHITDLHDGNIGYIDGFPVLVDYSNYNEW